jgi:uroporphyrinogen decarboxylase
MTSKERFIAAMSFQQEDDMVSMYELEFQIYKEYVDEDPVVGNAYAKLTTKEKEYALSRNAEIFIEAARKAGHDGIKDLSSYWEVAPGVPAELWLPTIEDRIAQVQAIKREVQDEFFIMATVGGLVGTIPDSNHLYNFIDRLYDHPQEVLDEAEKILQQILEEQKRFLEVGVDGMMNASDIAFNTGTFLSPDQLREVFFPYLTRWAEACKRDGTWSVLHTDGNLWAVLDDLIASGIDAIQCIDPLAEMADIGAVKEKTYGKVALIGNVDCSILHKGTPEEIEAICEYVIERGKGGGGFIFGGCNAIFKGISAENYQIMVDARKKYGSY